MLQNLDFSQVVQGILAVLITIGCFAAFMVYQVVPEWAISLLVLVYGFFFGSRFGALVEKQKRSNGNES